MKNYKNNEMLMEAIDNYDTMRKSMKTILKTLIQLAKEDYSILISVKELCKICKISNPVVYSALESLENRNFIKRHGNTRHGNTIIIVPESLNEVMERYNFLKK